MTRRVDVQVLAALGLALLVLAAFFWNQRCVAAGGRTSGGASWYVCELRTEEPPRRAQTGRSSDGPMLSLREARLRQEYAQQYPDLKPGVWVPAHVLAEFVLERGLYQRRTGTPSRTRLLEEAHFEFRGGDARSPELREGSSERVGDHLRP